MCVCVSVWVRQGVSPTMMGAVSGMQPYSFSTGTNETTTIQPFQINRCLGDDVAFAMLEKELTKIGVTDWRPDGIVHSKGVNDPSDKMSDEVLEARDGQLFNMHIQGPAITSSWTGNPALETLPLDKVFVVIVADVWWGDTDAMVDGMTPPLLGGADKAQMKQYLQGKGTGDNDQIKGYHKMRDAVIAANNVTKTALGTAWFASASKPMTSYKEGEETTMCNFRVMLATSSQMVNYSYIAFGSDGKQKIGHKLDPGKSRMGLVLTQFFGEYIVGGWCIGSVLDTAASRGSMPGSGNIGVRTAPNSMALNINVEVCWWDADRMWRSFMNKEDSVTPRYVQTKPDAALKSVNKPFTDSNSEARKIS